MPKLIKKFKRAFVGLWELAASELSFRLEIAAAFLVLFLAWRLRLRREELAALLAVVFALLILEGLNTVLERIIDLAEPRYQERTRQIKDALAALVLLATVAAVTIGIIIFWPYF